LKESWLAHEVRYIWKATDHFVLDQVSLKWWTSASQPLHHVRIHPVTYQFHQQNCTSSK